MAKFILINTGRGEMLLNAAHILRITQNGEGSYIVLINNEGYHVEKTLAELQKELDK